MSESGSYTLCIFYAKEIETHAHTSCLFPVNPINLSIPALLSRLPIRVVFSAFKPGNESELLPSVSRLPEFRPEYARTGESLRFPGCRVPIWRVLGLP